LLNGNPIGGARTRLCRDLERSYTVTTTDATIAPAPLVGHGGHGESTSVDATITPRSDDVLHRGSVTLTSSAPRQPVVPQRQPDRRRHEHDLCRTASGN